MADTVATVQTLGVPTARFLEADQPRANAGDDPYLLPNGRMDSNNAAKYVNRAPKTLAMWRSQGIGPGWTKVGGSLFYKKEDPDRFLSDVEAA